MYDWLLAEDAKHDAETWRDRLEYIVMFFNSEAILKLQQMRKQKKLVSDGEFNQLLEKQFGRPMSNEIDVVKERIREAEESGEIDKIRVVNKKGEIETLESSFAKKFDPNDFRK